ncbi:MAG: YjjG family noncanonical pyrimidine nucleotidase, partial [Eubacterium sp.]
YNLGECNADTVKRYSDINASYWKKLERGELTKQQVLEYRFIDFFKAIGVKNVNANEFCREYESHLCDTICFLDNADALLNSFKGKYRQYAVTNGRYDVQAVKLKKSGLCNILDGAFISDEVGYEKPSKQFFDYVFANIEPCEKDEIIIVGDSLTSDMQGGNNAGIKCCWYNPSEMENTGDVTVDFEIKSLNELPRILNTL